MVAVAVIGAQWGDEGKGKIVDELSMGADFVVRFQGGRKPRIQRARHPPGRGDGAWHRKPN